MKKLFTLLLLGGLLFVGAGNVWGSNYLKGSWDEYVTGVLFRTSGNHEVATIYLDGSTDYWFYIDVNGSKFKNSGAITSNTDFSSGWWVFSTGANNYCKITTGSAGAYTFTISWGGDNNSVPYVKVDYASSSGTTYTITFDNQYQNWAPAYAHVYDASSNNVFGAFPGVAVIEDANDLCTLSFTTSLTPAYVIWSNGSSGSGNQSTTHSFYNGWVYDYSYIFKIITPTPSDYYATFFDENHKVELASGVTAYTAKYTSGNSLLTLTEFDGDNETIVPANTAVLLKASSNSDFRVTIKDDATAYAVDASTNSLLGSNGTASGGDGIYVLGVEGENSSGTAFYKFPSGTIPANRAYLSTGETFAPDVIRIVEGENNTTNLKNVETPNNSVKFIKNGQLYIMRDGIVYDVMGRIAE